jgi:hypothetical protein
MSHTKTSPRNDTDNTTRTTRHEQYVTNSTPRTIRHDPNRLGVAKLLTPEVVTNPDCDEHSMVACVNHPLLWTRILYLEAHLRATHYLPTCGILPMCMHPMRSWATEHPYRLAFDLSCSPGATTVVVCSQLRSVVIASNVDLGWDIVSNCRPHCSSLLNFARVARACVHGSRLKNVLSVDWFRLAWRGVAFSLTNFAGTSRCSRTTTCRPKPPKNVREPAYGVNLHMVRTCKWCEPASEVVVSFFQLCWSACAGCADCVGQLVPIVLVSLC